VSSRAFILGGVCLALALSGCSLAKTSASNGGFTGQQGLIAATLNTLASDSNSANGADICINVFAATLRARLNKIGKCATIIDNQLKTIDDFKLTIKKIQVNGSAATARVQSVHNGKQVIQTVSLTHESAGWRVVSAA
jgi:hypothetical protein